MEQSDRKETIRSEVKALIEALDPAEAHDRSVEACERLMKAPFYRDARTVMLYLPMDKELDVSTLALRCFQAGKTVCAPRIDWEHRRLAPIEIRCFEESFEVRRHGIREPQTGGPVPLQDIDLFIVPGLAFDAAGRRVGRGGGFYDRFLTREGVRGDAVKCGLCYDFQIVDEAPVDPHDVVMGGVGTDRRLIVIGARKPV